MRLLKQFLLLLVLLGAPAAPAAAAEPAPALRQRAADLVPLFNGATPPAPLFAPSFLAAVPEAQVASIAAQLRASYGAAKSVGTIEAANPWQGIVRFAFEKATLRMSLAVDPAEPHLVTGLRIEGVEGGSDTARSVLAEIGALPGLVSLSAALLGDKEPPQAVLALQPDRPMAVGSAFKLWVLAELAREVKAGERRWSDVAPLGPPSLPFGRLRSWPRGSPMTLHSLAAAMISESDNTAADTLLALLGREKVERLLPALGVGAAERDRPLLLTREAAALKADAALRSRWLAAGPAGRRALLGGEVARADLARIDLAALDTAPVAADQVEWFASTSDLVRSLDWLRRAGDSDALAILAINPGLPAAIADFYYAGYKGGSETGVLSLAFLLRRRDGRWLAVAVAWNDPAAKLDDNRLLLLMSRLLPLLARGEVERLR
ncbi:MAG: serine hydrolase [Allosphingosinicella sp.]